MFVVYLTMYSGTKMPRWYIGSSYEKRVLKGYNGSVKSKKWKEIYKQEQKENKHLFKTRILSYHLSRDDALSEEYRLQQKHNVIKNKNYFNESYASKNGCFGRDVAGKLHPLFGKGHSEQARKNISKNHADCSGKNNSRALKIGIYDENGIKIFETHGNFKTFCQENNLPFTALTSSYQNEGELIYTNAHMDKRQRFNDWKKFQFWYARVIK